MGTPLGPKYIPYTYMDPLGFGFGLTVSGPGKSELLTIGVVTRLMVLFTSLYCTCIGYSSQNESVGTSSSRHNRGFRV